MSYEHDHFHPDRQRIFKVIPDLIASSGTNINELKLIGDFSSMPPPPPTIPTTDTSFYVNSTVVANPQEDKPYIGSQLFGFGNNEWDLILQTINSQPYSLWSKYQNCGHPLIVPKEDIVIDTEVYPQSTFMSAWGTITGPIMPSGAGANATANAYVQLWFHPCVDEGDDLDGDGFPDGPSVISPIIMATTSIGFPKFDGINSGTTSVCWEIPWFEFPHYLSPSPTSHYNLIYVSVRWGQRGGEFPSGNYPFTYSIQIENEAVV